MCPGSRGPTNNVTRQRERARSRIAHIAKALSNAPEERENKEAARAKAANQWALNAAHGDTQPGVCVAAATHTCPHHTAERAGGTGTRDTLTVRPLV